MTMNEPTLIIRQASLSDVDDMVLLLRSLFSIEADFSFDEARQRQGLAMILNNSSKSCILVAQDHQQVVGMCSVQLLISTAQGGLAGLVEDMVVLSDWRGNGIGRRLLTAIEQWAWERGASRLQLLADQHNAPAFEFYDKMGWSPTRLICLRKLIEDEGRNE